jgi:hypothetical protein
MVEGSAASQQCLKEAKEPSNTDPIFGPVADVTLTGTMLSGREVSVTLPSQSFVAQLRCAFADAFGLEQHGEGLRMIFGSRDLSEVEGQLTLEEAGLVHGSRLEVGLRSWVRPMEVPAKCRLTLQGRRRCRSSAFIIRYELTIDVPGNRIQAEKWRKHDHDYFDIDTFAGTTTGYRGHWMCGNTDVRDKLSIHDVALADMLEQWIGQCKPVFSEADRFWKSSDSLDNDTHKGARQDKSQHVLARVDDCDIFQNKPQGHAPDWFAAPSPECTELIVNAKLPFMDLLRVLLDAKGRPIRAAVFAGCPNHDLVEEYDVDVKHPEM